MKVINSVKNILIGLSLSLKRFPITILLSASVAATLITISETNPKLDTLSKTAMVLALGIPLSLCIKLFFERVGNKNPYKLIATYTVGALFLIIYYFLFLKNIGMVETTRYTAVSVALYLGFLFIPFFLRKQQFEMYIVTVFSGFFITVIYSVVMYSGLSAILFTIDKLLGIKILGKVYYYTFLFVVFIFALSYFLAETPTKEVELTPKTYPKLLRILLLYIVMPLLTAYTIILYIYFGKIIAISKWPVGIVSHLVLWYSVITTTVLFFITPIRDEKSWQRKFFKFFPKIILPLLIMMFISMGIRINAYGVTEKRYYVVVLGGWVFFIMLYFAFSKKLRNIIIPLTLSIVALASVFGPFSSYSISIMSQNNRLEKILIKDNLLKDNKIKSSSDISKEDKYQISSILRYFQDNHSLKQVKILPSNFKLEDMNKLFGFSYQNQDYGGTDGYFNFMKEQSNEPINIQGYDYLFDKILSNNIKSSNTDLNINYNYESAIVVVRYKGSEVYKKDLHAFAGAMAEKQDTEIKGKSLSALDMTLVDENERIKIKFIFSNISGNKDYSTGEIDIKEIDFSALVKIK